MEEGVAYYEIPMPDELLYSGLPLYEQLYCKGVFYYLVSRLQLPKEVYCHFNFTSHYYLALLFKEKCTPRSYSPSILQTGVLIYWEIKIG